MDCKKARFDTHLYMDDKLETNELEQFIKHVHSCPDCYEELEISYIMIEGMNRLENGEGLAVNFQKELKTKLKKQLSRIQRRRRTIIQFVLIGILISLFGILLGYFEQEDHTTKVMQQMLQERQPYYYYENTKYYIFEAGDYIPPSLREIVDYGK